MCFGFLAALSLPGMHLVLFTPQQAEREWGPPFAHGLDRMQRQTSWRSKQIRNRLRRK